MKKALIAGITWQDGSYLAAPPIEEGLRGPRYHGRVREVPSLCEILGIITPLSGQKISVERDRSLSRPADTKYICADVTAIALKVGWASEYSLSEIMRT